MGSLMSTASDKKDGDWVEGAAADFDFVRFTMSDINGVPRSKLIPKRQVDEKLKTGVGIPSGETRHCLEYINESYIHRVRKKEFSNRHNFNKFRRSLIS